MDLETKVLVTNRSGGSVGYTIDSLRVSRTFEKPGDFNFISVDELIELTTVPGGLRMLNDLLIIGNEEAVREVLGGEQPPEYNYGLKEIDYLLYEGEAGQLMDCLDYAPQGVLELIKDAAMKKLPNTTEKVAIINEKYGIDITALHRTLTEDAPEATDAPEDTGRRSNPVVLDKDASEVKTPRKYNVVK